MKIVLWELSGRLSPGLERRVTARSCSAVPTAAVEPLQLQPETRGHKRASAWLVRSQPSHCLPLHDHPPSALLLEESMRSPFQTSQCEHGFLRTACHHTATHVQQTFHVSTSLPQSNQSVSSSLCRSILWLGWGACLEQQTERKMPGEAWLRPAATPAAL